MKFNEFLQSKEISNDAYKDMGAEEIAGLFVEYNEKNSEELESLVSNKASKEDIQALKDLIASNNKEQLKTLNEQLKAQNLIIKRLTPEEAERKHLSVGDQLTKALEANKDKLTVLKNGSASEVKLNAFRFDVKAPASMTFANVSGGNIPVEDRIEGLNIIPSRRVRLLDIMSRRGTESNVISWVYQANKDGSAGQTAEGTTKNQIDFDLVIDSESVVKSTAFIKVSTEMLDDISWIRSEIQNELFRELLKIVELQAYAGDGTGQNHNGIRTVASAFAAGSFANTVDNANIVDVLTVAMNQIDIAQENEGVANYILMHPSDVTSLKLTKLSSTDKRYVDRLMTTGSNMELDGVPIIKTTLVTQGEYLVGAFDLAMLVERSEVSIDIGLDGNDFTQNFRTILAEWRGCTIVKNNDRTAFVAGDFATDEAALETA